MKRKWKMFLVGVFAITFIFATAYFYHQQCVSEQRLSELRQSNEKPSSEQFQEAPLRKIAFESSRSGSNDIYIMDIDGSNVTRLTKMTLGGYQPDWSPDGKYIAFSSGINLEGRGIHIYVVSVNEGWVVQLTKSTNTVSEYPAYSPDGKKIAFASAPLFNMSSIGQYNIYTMNSDGSNLTKLTENGGTYPCWSPDGEKIAFASRETDSTNIYIMDADGSNQTKLTEGYQPDWSPDGKKIAFTFSQWPRKIGVINVDGSELIWLTDPPTILLPDGKVTHAKDENPKWSSDGKYIAFASTREDNWDIYVMKTDAPTEITRLTTHERHDQHPAWSPFLKP